MIVIKFGGTSVSSKKNIKTILKIVKRNLKDNPIVVVSALSGITDLLLSLINSSKSDQEKILKEIQRRHFDLVNDYSGQLSPDIKEYIDHSIEELTKLLKRKTQENSFKDEVLSYGEKMSSYIITQFLNSSQINSKQIIASNLIITDNHFGSAEFFPELTKIKTKKILLPIIKKGIVPVITGFIASNKKGQITTLGRGGSDYTAAIIGYALNAKEIQIWTDVDGILTTDPKFVKGTTILEEVSYREASELVAFGAKVLHPRTIGPPMSAGIPVRVFNTFNPNVSGTLIRNKSNGYSRVAAIAAKRKITLVNIYSTDMLLAKGFLARVFKIFSKHNISIDLVSVSEVSISVSLDNDDNLEKAIKELEGFATVSTTSQLGMVSVIGEKIVEVDNILRTIFATLDEAKIKVKMISLGATDINISLVLPSSKIDESLVSLHRVLITDRSML